MSARPTFSSRIEVQLVKASASDSDVAFAARVSTAGERSLDFVGTSSGDASPGLIRYLMRERHGSPFEHNTVTFFVRAPIFVFRELMRHRIASYNEESARYRQLAPSFYIPDSDRALIQIGKPGHYSFEPGTQKQHEIVDEAYRSSCTFAYESYQRMLASGVAREVARGVLPVTIFSTAYVTINARSLMNVLSLRVTSPISTYPSYPQREIEMVGEQMEAIWAELMPITHEAFILSGRVSP